MTNISQSFTHKMAAKISWHRYGKKLRHSHPMHTSAANCASVNAVANKQRRLFMAAKGWIKSTRIRKRTKEMHTNTSDTANVSDN